MTMRGRKNMGKRVFIFEDEFSDAEIYSEVLPEFYRFYAPLEIRISTDFPTRINLADQLSKREKRKIKIIIPTEKNQKKTIDRAIEKNKHEFDLRNIKPPILTKNLQTEIKRIFKLKKLPKRIEAFDAAHISGANAVGANAVWENGKFISGEYKFWFSDGASELETLQNAISARFADRKNLPDLILIDGGSSQLNAALNALENFTDRNFFIISAVKPPKKHGEISHFLTETGEKIEFETGGEAFRFLQFLRDEAHNAANSVHRTSRDFSHFYELAAVLPNAQEKTRREILRKFGSINNLKNVPFEDLKANFVLEIAETIWNDLQNLNKTAN